jgi:branched-chain amino acid transport system ATP-binding protein
VSQLVVDALDVYYGAVHALKGVSLRVEPGEIVTLIGANGAGKTTLLRTISGIVPARSGTVSFEGKVITKLPAHEIVGLGVSQSPRAAWCSRTSRSRTIWSWAPTGAATGTASSRTTRRCSTCFPRLLERRKQLSGTLSGGEQQMLAMGRALMSRPRLLLLDEPSLGIAPLLVRDIFRTIGEINRAGTTVLLVEQNAHMALGIAQRGYVLETGRVVLEDTAAKLAANDEVRAAYLGG